MNNYTLERQKLITLYRNLAWRVLPVHSVTASRCTCGRDPCDNAGKHPIVNDWVNEASTDEAKIDAWFQKWPWANIGVATGPLSRIVAIDVDRQHDGGHSIFDLERQHGNFPRTVRSLTGGGGEHIIFEFPAGLEVPSRRGIFQGVDVRGNGGFIVVPPSRHQSGRDYAWDAEYEPGDVHPAALPPWLEQRLVSNAKKAAKTSDDWADILEAGKHQGGRNASLASVIGHLFRKNVNIQVIVDLVSAWNEKFVSPPQSFETVMKTVASVAKTRLKRTVGSEVDHV